MEENKHASAVNTADTHTIDDIKTPSIPQENENWSIIIKPKRDLLDIRFREIIRYRDLLWLLLKRDFVTQYKQTILGPLWFIINPIFSTIMYTFVFGQLAAIGTDGIPHTLFYFSGSMLWILFSGCFNDSRNVFITNAHIYGKVYFPRLIIPISYTFSNIIRIAVQFVVLIIFIIYFKVIGFPIVISWKMLLFPVFFLWICAIGVGAGIIISSVTTKYRDLTKLVDFALQLFMYATPVVYPLSEIPQSFRWVAYINPVSAPIELFRNCFFGAGSTDFRLVAASLVATSLLLFFGIIIFNQNESTFIDVV